MNIKRLLTTRTGTIIISVILGLGLAALFRRACKDNNCIIVKGPSFKDTKDHVYKVNDECYKYEPVFTECTKNAVNQST